MNASIQGIIDHMFRDTIDNTETRALHEELLNNCMEHYDDLIGRGMSETEAIDAVVDSLKGMKEVIDEYPKKPSAANKEAEEKKDIPQVQAEDTKKKEPVKEKPTEYVYDGAAVTKIRTELKNCDLQVGISNDNRIHVRCEDMDQLICNMDGSTLSVRIADRAKQSLQDACNEVNKNEFTLSGLLSFLGKAIGTAASSITVSWNVYIDLPAGVPAEIELSAKSGDVDYRAGLPERMSVHSMSGEIKVESTGSKPAEKIALSTMSGDIEFNGNAKAVAMSSMSGDVTARGEFRDAEMKSTSGDVKLIGCTDHVRLSSVSGDADAEMKNIDVHAIEARTTSGDVDISLAPGTESIHANVSTVSGSSSNRFADGGAGAQLQITASSVSGDVTIR